MIDIDEETRQEMKKTEHYLWSDFRIFETLEALDGQPFIPSDAHAIFLVMMTLRNEYQEALERLQPQPAVVVPVEVKRALNRLIDIAMDWDRGWEEVQTVERWLATQQPQPGQGGGRE